MAKPIFIHVIGIEGTGHHFYESYIPKLLRLYNKTIEIYDNNDSENNFRNQLIDIYWVKNTKEMKIKKYNEFIKKIINN